MMSDLDVFLGVSKKGVEKIKYFLNRIGKNGLDWTWWYLQFTNYILPLFYKGKTNNGIYVMERRWDNLIILDACRYDAFEKVFEREKSFFGSFKVSLEKVYSRGSCTVEFLLENFAGRQYEDVIYITANPYVYTLLPRNTFFKVVNVWRTHWDDNLGTVHPQAVTKKAIEVYYKYPDKRLIIHFMQPHPPFIGKYRKSGNLFCSIALKEGLTEAIKAYLSNLDMVFSYVKLLLEMLDGVTVVTSDHGEAWGELAFIFPIYGHPMGIRIPSIREVPWLTVYKEKKITHLSEKTKLRRSIKALKHYTHLSRKLHVHG